MTIWYVDPDWGGANNGTEAEPLNAIIDVPLADNDTILIKRGTTHNVTTFTTSQKSGITISAYGVGPYPILTSYTANTTPGDWTEGVVNNWNKGGEDLNTVVLGYTDLGNVFRRRDINLANGHDDDVFVDFGDWDTNATTLTVYSENNPITDYGTVYISNLNSPAIRFENQNSPSSASVVENIRFEDCARAIWFSPNNSNVVQNPIIRNCEFIRCYKAITLSSPNDVEIDNARIHDNTFIDCYNIGVNLANGRCPGALIYNNGFVRTGAQESISPIYIDGSGGTASEPVKVYDNIIDVVYSGRYWNDGDGIYVERGSTYVNVYQNKIYNITEDNGAALRHNSMIAGEVNWFTNYSSNCQRGLELSDSNNAFTGTANIYQNTFRGCLQHGLYLEDADSGPINIANNVLEGAGTGIHANVGIVPNITENNNCVFGFTTDYDNGTLDPSTITDDPKLKPSGRLQDNSPCIDAGVVWWTGTAPAGNAGYQFGYPPSIGAFAYLDHKTTAILRKAYCEGQQAYIAGATRDAPQPHYNRRLEKWNEGYDAAAADDYAEFCGLGPLTAFNLSAIRGVWSKAVFRDEEINLWDEVKDNPLVDGFVINYNWSSVETAENTYNWANFDNYINQIDTLGKQSEITIAGGHYSPQHVKDLPTVNTFTLTINAVPVEVPYFWDQPYLDEWFVMIDALAQKYDADKRVNSVVISGPHYEFAEFFVSNAYVPDLEAEGWTAEKHVAAWKQCIDYYAEAFKRTIIIFRGAPILDRTDDVFEVMDHIRDNHPYRSATLAGSIADNGNIENPNSLFNQYWVKMYNDRKFVMPLFDVGEELMSDGPQWAIPDADADVDAYNYVLEAIDQQFGGLRAFNYEGRLTNTDVPHDEIFANFRNSVKSKRV